MEEEATDVSEPKCPFTDHGDDVQNGKRWKQDGNESSNSETLAAKPVPYQWWKFSLLNFLQLKKYGWNFYQHAMEANKSTVFSVKLDEWTTFVCDHVGMASVLDLEKVERDSTGHGFLNFRPHMMRNHIPCLWSNDEAHEKKKNFLLTFVKDVYDNMADQVVGVIRKEFENMKALKFSNAAEAKKFDCERVFIDVFNNVTCYMLLGEYFEDTMPIDKWRTAIFQQEGILFGSPGDMVGMTNKVFDMFKSVKKFNELSSRFPDSGLDENEMFHEALYMTCCNASPGIQIFSLNSLLCYIKLPESDKELLKQEAEKFFAAAGNHREVLQSLHHLHAFFLEVIRVHALPTVYGRAKKDFIMTSTSGNFTIKKGNNLCGMPYYAHRDEKLFDQACTFNMHRDVKHVEGYNFSYGGYYYAQPSGSNHKCAGAALSMEIVKMITLFFTKCKIVPAQQPVYTGHNIRKFACEQPLALLEFSYSSDGD